MGIEGIGGPSSFGGGGGAGRIQHLVQQGDTLDGIAQQYGLTTEVLLNNNAHLKGVELKPGMVLDFLCPSDPSKPAGESQLAGDVLDKFDPSKYGFNPQPEPPDVLPQTSGIPTDQFSVNPTPSPRVVSALNFALTPDQFQINDQGHLLIKNDFLGGVFVGLKDAFNSPAFKQGEALMHKVGDAAMFKAPEGEALMVKIEDALMYKAPEGDVLSQKVRAEDAMVDPGAVRSFQTGGSGDRFGDELLSGEALSKKFAPGESLEMKVGAGEQLMINGGTEDLILDLQDFHVNERGEAQIANEKIVDLFRSVLDRQDPGEARSFNFSVFTKPKGE